MPAQSAIRAPAPRHSSNMSMFPVHAAIKRPRQRTWAVDSSIYPRRLQDFEQRQDVAGETILGVVNCAEQMRSLDLLWFVEPAIELQSSNYRQI